MANFDAAAAGYDRTRHAMIPDYDIFYGTAVSALPFGETAQIKVLDLGCGTGGFAAGIINTFPNAQIVLSDISSEMLAKARIKFAGDNRFSFVESDCLSGDYGGTYDAVVSSLMIHHLEHDEKRKVFGYVFKALKPGGVFVNMDQFEARTPAIHEQLFLRWLADVKNAGVSVEDLSAALKRLETFDRNAPMQDQFVWLEEAGFRNVDILYRNYFWAVFVATRP